MWTQILFQQQQAVRAAGGCGSFNGNEICRLPCGHERQAERDFPCDRSNAQRVEALRQHLARWDAGEINYGEFEGGIVDIFDYRLHNPLLVGGTTQLPRVLGRGVAVFVKHNPQLDADFTSTGRLARRELDGRDGFIQSVGADNTFEVWAPVDPRRQSGTETAWYLESELRRRAG